MRKGIVSHGGAEDTEGKMRENEVGTLIVEEAIRLHWDLGPGLLEGVYERSLAIRLRKTGLKVDSQVPIPIVLDGERFDEGFHADLIVDEKLIVELKSLEKIAPVHQKQLLSYLRLSGLKLGYLLNFGEVLMKDGIYRVINGVL